MSPNPEEEGHSERGWTHRICLPCYGNFRLGNGWAETPGRVRDDIYAPCCYCGRPTHDGIYVRQDPAAVHGVRS